MKYKIRTRVFETNSSSVHSLTFFKKGTSENTALVKDNILYPDVFYATKQNYSDPDDCCNGDRWCAHSQDEKAAMLFLYLNDVMITVGEEKDSQWKSWNSDMAVQTVEYAKSKLPYTDVILGEKSIGLWEDRGEIEWEYDFLNPGAVDRYGDDLINEMKNSINGWIDAIMNPDVWVECVQGSN